MSERLELGTWKLRKDRHRYDGGLFAPRPAPVQEGSTRFQERTSYMYSGGAVRERPSTLSQRYPPQRNPVGRHWIAARITPANAVLDVCAYLDCHYGRTLSYYVQPEKDRWSHSAMDISNSFLNQFEKNRQFIETQDCVNVYIQFASSTVALTVIDNGHFEFNNEVKTRTAVKAPQVPYGAQYTSVSVDIAPCTELGFLEKLKKVEEDKKRDMVFTSAETVVEKEKTSADISPVSSRSDDSSLPAQTSSSSDKGAEAPSCGDPT
ncbi:hypothetical protein AGDE_13400 [Angomonas deanei]|uniref:Uncharacterized protein n=1 Tax=Angomonas deanei TaxID=59799 RepID=A0A7G2C691_9TRYP|nr:hypothetical protein AGDE_13400 [Angomonas deanei]CAD2214624.1 hypothetical protein, conserved [Angomonas deanei]|eukprot:EPY22412.1 hypothetical protein AGDE_13400 [Angomonas deanei]